MPSHLVTDDQLLARLTEVFRSSGFEGASLNDLAAATGLQKSSLYHRFPGGKAQMAAEVVHETESTVGAALAPLTSSAPIRNRIEKVGRELTAFYDAGAKSCLLDTLSIGAVGPETAACLNAAAHGWIDAFANVARSSGATPTVARERAQDAVAAIEGALVLARVTGDRRPFARAIRRLADALLGTQGMEHQR